MEVPAVELFRDVGTNGAFVASLLVVEAAAPTFNTYLSHTARE